MDEDRELPLEEGPPKKDREKEEPQTFERPDWLVGADEIQPAEVPREQPFQPPLAPRTEPRSLPDQRQETPGSSRPDADRASWPMPTNDVVTGSNMYDFRQEEAAAPRSDPKPEMPGPETWQPATPPPDPEVTQETRRAPVVELPPLAPPPATPKRSWLQTIKQIRVDPRVIAIAVGVVAVIALSMAVADAVSVTPVKRIRNNPKHFDGVTVKVRGTVGEVYAVGDSYTFYLLDARDTLVVFTRTRTPHSHEKVTLFGSVSTGYLEGVPRVALFEQNP